MRARLAIVISDRLCELREVVLRNKPQALLDASPKATVPVLVDTDGAVIDQSLDIMMWALRQNDPEKWLGASQDDFDAMLVLIQECDQRFKRDLDRFKYPQRYPGAVATEHRDGGAAWLLGLESRLRDQPYLFGDRISLADAAIMPFVRQFALTDRDWFSSQPWPALQQWLDAWLHSPLFDSVMSRVPAWQPDASRRFIPYRE
jgi:glutathione S-transferase